MSINKIASLAWKVGLPRLLSTCFMGGRIAITRDRLFASNIVEARSLLGKSSSTLVFDASKIDSAPRYNPLISGTSEQVAQRLMVLCSPPGSDELPLSCEQSVFGLSLIVEAMRLCDYTMNLSNLRMLLKHPEAITNLESEVKSRHPGGVCHRSLTSERFRNVRANLDSIYKDFVGKIDLFDNDQIKPIISATQNHQDIFDSFLLIVAPNDSKYELACIAEILVAEFKQRQLPVLDLWDFR